MIPQQQIPPKQVTYPAWSGDVQTLPDGQIALAVVTPYGETLVLLMSKDYAAELGKKLAAPRIVVVNGLPPAARN